MSHFRNPALLHLSLWRDVSIMDWHIPLQDYPALPRRTPAVKRNTSLLTSVRAAFHPVTGTRPAVFLNLSRSERVPRVTRWHSGSAMGFAARSQVLIINHTEIKPSDAVFYSPEPPVCFLHKSPMQRGFAAITRSVIKSVVLLRQRKIGRQFTEPQTALYINRHPALQFLSALCSVLVSFSSLFWLYKPQLHCFSDKLSRGVGSLRQKKKKALMNIVFIGVLDSSRRGVISNESVEKNGAL